MSSWAPPGGGVATPAALVDAGRLDRNLRAMAESAAHRGLTLRPHGCSDRVVVIPNHVCTTVNLVDELHVVRDGQVAERWPVDARGRNS